MREKLLVLLIALAAGLQAVSFDQWQNIRFSALQPSNYVYVRTDINQTNITDNKLLTFSGTNVAESDLLNTTPGVYQQVIPTSGGRAQYGFRKSVDNQPYNVVPLPFSGTSWPTINQLTKVSSDPANDQATNYLDIVSEYVTFSDTKLYAAIQNRGGGFPTRSSIFGPYFAYSVAFGDPTLDLNSPNAVAWAMNYVSVPALFSTGLYKITGTTISDITRVGDISYSIDSSNNLLRMSCDLSQLMSDPDFTAWFNPDTRLVGQISLINKVTLPATVEQSDYTNGGYVFLKNLFVDPVSPSSLSMSGIEFVDTPEDVYFKVNYNAPADVFPLAMYFVNESQNVFEMSGASQFFTGNPMLYRTANLVDTLPQTASSYGNAWMHDYYDYSNGEYTPHYTASDPVYYSFIRAMNSPTNLFAEPGNGVVSLSWIAAERSISGYRIYRNGTAIATVTGTSYSDTNISNGTTYSYYVTTVYVSPTGESEPSNTVVAIPTSMLPEYVSVGSGTSTTGSYTASPVNEYYKSLHGQSVYTREELNALGICGQSIITQLGFNIVGAPSYAMPNFIVRMKHTSSPNVASWQTIDNMITVYSNDTYLPNAGGWNMLTLSTPFVWDGVNNIVVDTAFGTLNANSGSGTVQYTSTATGYRYLRSNTVDQTNIFASGTTISLRPNIRFYVFTESPSEPSISVSTTNLAFGGLVTNSSNTLQFTIRNNGDLPLNGAITTPLGYTVSLATRELESDFNSDNNQRNAIDFSILGGNSLVYNLTFLPAAVGTYNGNVVISSNASNNPTLNIVVTGTGYVPPTINISCGDPLYTSLEVDTQGSDSFVITNLGSQPLQYSIVIENPADRSSGNQSAIHNIDRNISGSTFELGTSQYTADTTLNWVFTVYNASTDTEWIKDIYLSFPAGVTVNSASTFVGGTGGAMTPNLTNGSGITINWHGSDSNGYGFIRGNETAVATVNVSINPTAAGILTLNYQLNGDIWGSEPHTLSGAINLTDVDWVVCSPSSGTIQGGNSVTINAAMSATGKTAGTYNAEINISSNDTANPTTTVSAAMEVYGVPNQAPVINLPDSFSFETNSSLLVNLADYANDPDNDPLTVQIAGNTNVHYNVNGLEITFTATSDWVGMEPLNITVSDGNLSASDQVQINVHEITSLATPIIAINMGVSSLELSWEPILHADYYNIYASNNPNNGFEFLGNTANTYFDVSTSQYCRFYMIKAVRGTATK
jgi:hypothetical protein